jgi:alpha-glucosidase (family GH31 glycosyl hydrolase)
MIERHDTDVNMSRYTYAFINTFPKAAPTVPREKWQTSFEAPLDMVFPAKLTPQPDEPLDFVPTTKGDKLGYEYKIGTTVVLSTVDMPVVMARQFNRLSFKISTSADLPMDMQAWGMGEQVTDKFFLEDGIYSFWNRDNGGENYSSSSLPGKNIYGTHPFLMFKSKAGDFVGFFLNNANGIDMVIETIDATTKQVVLSMNGGTLDFAVFHDPNPINVIKKYHSIVGNPVQIPEWSLGWHQSRWGYDTLAKLQAAVKNNTDASIPLDAIWSDIDYMQDYRDFTWDPTRFAGLNTWVTTEL